MAQHLGALTLLELVACTPMGVDHVNPNACWSHGLSVTNAGTTFAVDSGNYAVGILITVLRSVATTTVMFDMVEQRLMRVLSRGRRTSASSSLSTDNGAFHHPQEPVTARLEPDGELPQMVLGYGL